MDKKYNSDSPIVEEVRATRKKVWSDYGFDMNKKFDSINKKEAELKQEGIEFADDLKPCLPPDFEERVERLRAERNRPAA